jgi:hypothetical protein
MMMQHRPAVTHAVAVWELGRNRMAFAVEADAGETKTFALGKDDSNPAGGSKRIGHQSFTAGFVDRRAIAVGNDDTKTSGAGGNSDCEACRSTADYENICV